MYINVKTTANRTAFLIQCKSRLSDSVILEPFNFLQPNLKTMLCNFKRGTYASRRRGFLRFLIHVESLRKTFGVRASGISISELKDIVPESIVESDARLAFDVCMEGSLSLCSRNAADDNGWPFCFCEPDLR
jgi:hypothetical protein